MNTGAKILGMTRDLTHLISVSSRALQKAKERILLSSVEVMIMDMNDRLAIVAELRYIAAEMEETLRTVEKKLKELSEME